MIAIKKLNNSIHDFKAPCKDIKVIAAMRKAMEEGRL